ncbi:hypothetical protein CsSME_00023323 [Camellia sinensis var. sinensis]
MSSPSLSIRFAFVVSLSLAASYTSSSSSSSFPPFSTFLKLNPSPPNNPSTPKATPSDLLSLLGTPSQASSIDPNLAKELRSCLKFLVPFSPIPRSRPLLRGLPDSISNRKWNEENELVWWPPAPVMELARLAVDSGGDPDAIYRALDPTIIPVSFHLLLYLFFIFYFNFVAYVPLNECDKLRFKHSNGRGVNFKMLQKVLEVF